MPFQVKIWFSEGTGGGEVKGAVSVGEVPMLLGVSDGGSALNGAVGLCGTRIIKIEAADGDAITTMQAGSAGFVAVSSHFVWLLRGSVQGNLLCLPLTVGLLCFPQM